MNMINYFVKRSNEFNSVKNLFIKYCKKIQENSFALYVQINILM